MSYWFLLLVFIFGLLIGSFLNCLIWRLYKEETVLGRSKCPQCSKKISWYDNIPLLSFVFLKAKCRFCKGKISWQYPLVEFFTGGFFVLAFYFNILENFSPLQFFLNLFLISIFVIIFIFDLRWMIVPINVIILGAIFTFLLNWFLGAPLYPMLFSCLLGIVFFLLQYILTGKKGIGEGDIWLGGFLGLIFPHWSQLLIVFLLTYLIGGLTAIILLSLGFKKMGSRLPLGVFLMIAGVFSLFWVDKIYFFLFNYSF